MVKQHRGLSHLYTVCNDAIAQRITGVIRTATIQILNPSRIAFKDGKRGDCILT